MIFGREQGGAPKGAAPPPTAGAAQAQAQAPVQAPAVGLEDAVADAAADQEITLEQFKEQLRRIDKALRSLPATAQARPLRAALSRSLEVLLSRLLPISRADTPWPDAPQSCIAALATHMTALAALHGTLK